MLIRAKDDREAIAVFRAEVIGALTRRDLGRGELKAALLALSEERFRPPGSDISCCCSFSTLERWYYAYKSRGLPGITPKARADRGHGRGLSDELRQLLLDIRRAHPSTSAAIIRDTLISEGRLDKTVSVSLLRRLYRQHQLPRRPRKSPPGEPRQRLRWQAANPNALWHGDVCHGPKLVIDGVPKPLRIHALLDDHSRYVLALEARHTEREQDMLDIFASAIGRHGQPDVLYLDNGPTYRGEALSVMCARLGVGLVHARPYDPQARGKQERFWRTLRGRCLDHLGALSSLHDVQVRLYAFLDRYYQDHPHAGLLGRTPRQVWTGWWQQKPDSLRRPDPCKLREALTVRTRRHVRNDSTLSHEGTDWELAQGFVAKRRVVVGHCLLDRPIRPWVEYQGQNYPLHPVDPRANASRGRKATQSKDVPQVDFDPATALLNKMLNKKESE